jgi:hypothetical protein
LKSIVKGGKSMMPRRGWGGDEVRAHFTGRERLLALSDFYRNYKNGEYFEYFKAELKAMVQRGQGLNPNLIVP